MGGERYKTQASRARTMRRTARVAVLAVALALAGSPAGADGHVQTFVAFDATVPELPEGVAVDKTGNVYVSLVAPVRQIRRIDPDGRQAVLTDFNDLGVGGVGPAGVAVAPDGTVYAAVVGVDLSAFMGGDPHDVELPDTHGVYRVGPDGAAEHLPGTEQILFPNDVTLDKRGNVYVTDTIDGAVWRFPGRPGGGSAARWAAHDLLEGDGRFSFGFPIGANGIAVRHDRVIVGNTERGLLVDVPVAADGSAGSPTVRAASPALVGVDGIALDVHGDVYAGVGLQQTVIKVSGDGPVETLAGADDGLDQPSTLAFGTTRGLRQTLFVADFSYFSRCCPAVRTLAVQVPGQPLP